jgi:hypothetical protein
MFRWLFGSFVRNKNEVWAESASFVRISTYNGQTNATCAHDYEFVLVRRRAGGRRTSQAARLEYDSDRDSKNHLGDNWRRSHVLLDNLSELL